MDYGIFTAASLAVFLTIQGVIWWKGVSVRSAFLFWPVLLAILTGGWFFTDEAGKNERLRVERLIGGLAPTYAREMELLGHSDLMKNGLLNNRIYLKSIEAEKRWLSVNTAVADIYTCGVNRAGEYYFLVDSETDYDRNGRYEGEREMRTPVGELFRTAPPEIARAFRGEPCFTREIYSDRWGSWVSAFVPLHDSRGRVEAVLGVDYHAAKWLEAIRMARLRTIGFVGVAIVTLALFFSVFLFLQIDIRRRSLLEAELEDRVARRTSELQRLAAAIENAAEEVLIADSGGVLQYVNSAYENTSGQQREAVIGRRSLIGEMAGQYDEGEREALDAVMSGRVGTGRRKYRNRDGELYDAEVTVSPIRGEAGGVEGLVALRRDITLNLRLEEELRQAQKMEAIGLLAGGVAHDFNNLLTVIIGNTGLLLRGADEAGPETSKLHQIERAANQAALLTQQLLVFSRKQELWPRVLRLNEIIAESQPLLERLLGPEIEIVTNLDADQDRIKADPSQINQVLLNLTVNARDAMPQGGCLVIQTDSLELAGGDAASHHGLKPGPYVRLRVSDNGIGMDDRTRVRIFDPFFTTKERGKGTGLGLATTHGIVKQNKGAITVESEPGKGSVFTIFLPRMDDETEDRSAPAKPEVNHCGSEKVLVVEDEEGVREMMLHALTAGGYTVFGAGDAAEAMKICRERQGDLDLLIADIILPGGMNGAEMARSVTASLPQLQTLFVSGYTDNLLADRGILGKTHRFLQKPFTGEKLLEAVRSSLDSRKN